jgi:DNA-binding transcriptional LysR family regulator
LDRLEAMEMLVEAVEGGSLSAAGRKLNVPLPTISRKISDLEAHVGTQLLLRSTRRLALTDAGNAYIAASRRILEEVSQAERAAAGEYRAPKGELILTAPLAIGRRHVLPVVTAFLDQYPDITVRLLLSDRNAHFAEDHVDMAVRYGALGDSSMVATRIGPMRRVVCASPGFLGRHGEPLTPQDIQPAACVTHDMNATATKWTFRQPATGVDIVVPIRPRLSVTTADAAVEAAVGGIGLTRVLMYQAAPAIAEGTLKIILAPFELTPVPFHLLHASRGLMPLKMRTFLDFAAPRLRAAIAPFG